MQKIFLAILLFAVFASCSKKNSWTIYSPQGNIKVQLTQQANGQMSYSVCILKENSYVSAVKPSLLGIVRDDTRFVDTLKVTGKEVTNNRVHAYALLKGKRLKNRVFSNQLILKIVNKDNRPLELIFEVFDEGVGFKYRFPDKSAAIHKVSNELTEFALSTEGFAWIQPYDTLNTWSPAYEYGYEPKMKIGTKPPLSTGWGFPALFESNGTWLLLTETGLDETYCGSHLSANCANGIYRVEYPYEWENYGMWDAEPKNSLPWETPWRLIIIGNQPGDIIESNLVQHLAEPQRLSNTEWIKPGISSWNWWGDHSGGWKFNSLKDHIDLSAEMGWQYSLVDAEWQNMQGGTLEQLSAYAIQKGVKLCIWYNSGGPHSRVMDALPRDLMHIPEIRRAEMKRISKMGIKGIKVDFFQGDKQGTIQYYIDIIQDAAEYELLVITHGCTIPRGWDRTFPNLISMEAVRGGELYSWHEYPAQAVWQNTILPFTRNVLGSMDFTPVSFSDYSPEIKHVTTNAHELALSVIFESGIQHFADRAESFRAQPQPVLNFLKNIPVTWDNTHFLDGYPGEHVILAREHEDVLYLAGINGTLGRKTSTVKLPMLKEGKQYYVEIIKDGVTSREFTFDSFILKPNDSIEVAMEAAGGFTAKITELQQ